MNSFKIKETKDFNDAIIISNHLADIWKDNIDNSYYNKMYNYISKFNDGYLIGFLSNNPIASSVAFPVDGIPSFTEINNGNIFDFLNRKGKYYYIHIIQVIKNFRNKGFGIKLLKYQINTAKKINIRK